MKTETEVKIRLDEKDFAKILEKLGKPEFFVQKNAFYRFPEGFLRIRDENKKTIITYKGKSECSEFNEREEIEFNIHKSGLNELRDLFSKLGVKEALHYKKRRANFQLNGCVVSIDVLPNCGTYVEIEGNRKKIAKNLRALDLTRYPLESRSYFEMLGGKNGGS
jgi:predicted adenylyl cyclase CyaB